MDPGNEDKSGLKVQRHEKEDNPKAEIDGSTSKNSPVIPYDEFTEAARIQEEEDLNDFLLSSNEVVSGEDEHLDSFPVLLNDDEFQSHENDVLDLNPFDGLPYSTNYYQLLRERKTLPVWQAKEDFVVAVEESSVVLVTGKAGSGKSTQIPQWCTQLAKETDFSFGTVVCTQPVATAAMSLAVQ
uniref:ATP-dependent RNA helicase DQX1-like n=1 Tax=Ciona intestinalis TaxID=7719 RepID=UPI000EF53280